MSRDDLVATNEKIVASVTEQVVAQSPDTIIVVLSNPLDAMCHVAKNVSGFAKQRVVGQAGILDTARFRTFVAWETRSSVKDVQALVLGGHGDQMVPVASATTVGGVPLTKLVARDRIDEIVERTAKGRRRARQPPRHVRLVRARRRRGSDGRRDRPGRKARAAVHGVPRGRVRNRRALHGRPGEARRRRRRGDRRARPRRGEQEALRRAPTPSETSSASSRPSLLRTNRPMGPHGHMCRPRVPM